MMNRRSFLMASLAAAGAAQVAGRADEPIAPAPKKRGNLIVISTYSFWRFLPGTRLPIDECIRQAAAMGFDGVEILHRQMSEETGAARSLRREISERTAPVFPSGHAEWRRWV